MEIRLSNNPKMKERRVNLLHTLDHRRDSYGFALRPQHLQRYREYTDIYKEEEDERSEKWKIFLEQQAQFDQPDSSVEEIKEKLKPECTELRGEIVSERIRQRDDPECGTTNEFQFLQKSKELQSSGEYCQDLKHSEELQDEVQTPKEPTEEVKQYSKGQKDKSRISKNPTEEGRQHSEEQQEEAQILEELAEQVKQIFEEQWEEAHISKEPTEEVKQSKVDQKEAHLPKESAIGLQPSEEEVQGQTGTKGKKVIRWSRIRLALLPIDNLMNSRVKKKENMAVKKSNKSRDLAPIKEDGSCERESDEETRVEEIPGACASAPLVTSTVDNEPSSEPVYSWKEELGFLVRGGVPKDLRGEVWQAFVGVSARRVERYYEDLLVEETSADECKDQDKSNGLSHKWKKQIEKDIPRTFPGHPALDDRGRDSLRRVLIAYARHNPSVGYCQAMNFFAGLLLLLMPEENAFWTLVGIMDEYFDGYYTEEMIESQVDQLVFEELMRERFPKLVNHLDYLGVQVAWISGPWFLSIFINMLPWESVLRVWDVLLFEGNRVMLFRTALALMDLYGPALVTTKDAGDAITLLQSLSGSTFDSSQLVLTACMGFVAVTEDRLIELREKHRPAVLMVVEERSKRGRVWKDSKGLASKLYSFKHDRSSSTEERDASEGDKSKTGSCSSNLDDLLDGLNDDTEADSLPDLQEQVVWMKVELCRLLEEKRSATLRAEELETALMEMVKADNRLQLSAKIEQLEEEVADLQQALADKREQEAVMLQVLMRVEQEQRITEEARRSAEKDVAAQKYAITLLQEKYEKALVSLAQMEKRVVMAETMLEATLQYESGQAKAQSSPRAVANQSAVESPRRRMGIFSGWRDRNKGKPTNEQSTHGISANEEKETSRLSRESSSADEV